MQDLLNDVATVGSEFWSKIPAYRGVSPKDFSDPTWQEKNCLTCVEHVKDAVGGLASDDFLSDLADGIATSTMSVRITPYLIALVDWSSPRSDPIRRQFLPLRSEMMTSHPLLRLDSLNEHADEIAGGLVHRYPDRALFLATDRCPVYCRFCTRSYSVGVETPSTAKDRNAPVADRWRTALERIRAVPAIVDVVVSGGDCFRLKPGQLLEIGSELIAMKKMRRIRFASKGLSVLPMKIVQDKAWTEALIRLSDMGRSQGVEVSFHTHINHPHEMTDYVVSAAKLLFSAGVMVRNQSVLLRGVNDNESTMTSLVKSLSDNHIHPYYVYACDLVSGVEDMRTTVKLACDLEKRVRGVTAGYNTPTFVVDAPGGGGKRDVHSFETYDDEVGLAVYSAPSVRPGKLFLYPDPLHGISPAVASDWLDPSRARAMVESAISRAKGRLK